jgi:hypothetical protein
MQKQNEKDAFVAGESRDVLLSGGWGLDQISKYGLPPLPIPVGQLMPTPLSLTEHQMGAATIFCLFSVWCCVWCMPKFLHCQHSF